METETSGGKNRIFSSQGLSVCVCVFMCHVCACVMLSFFPQGIDLYAVVDAEEARQKKSLYPRPLNVIEGPLMKVHMYEGLEVWLSVALLPASSVRMGSLLVLLLLLVVLCCC